MTRLFLRHLRFSPLVPLSLAAALAMTALQGAAFAAAPAAPTRTISVDARGLDLTGAAGRAGLDERIETAARRACRPDDMRDLNAAAFAAACQREAVAAARGARDALVARAESGARSASRIEVLPATN